MRRPGLRQRRLVRRQPRPQHVLELQHVLHDVTDLYERLSVLTRCCSLTLARVAEYLYLSRVRSVEGNPKRVEHSAARGEGDSWEEVAGQVWQGHKQLRVLVGFRVDAGYHSILHQRFLNLIRRMVASYIDVGYWSKPFAIVHGVRG